MRLHARSAGVTGLALAILVAAGCERRPDAAPPEEPPSDTPPELADDLYPPEVAPGFALAVEKRDSRAYHLHGWTDRADQLRIEIEDGHNILFGPAQVPVQADHFRLDVVIQPTDRDHVFVYVTDAAGDRLAVVPVDTARTLTRVGPPERLGSASSTPPE